MKEFTEKYDDLGNTDILAELDIKQQTIHAETIDDTQKTKIIQLLDDKTDQIFTLRSGLASIYWGIRNYLPRDEQGNRQYLDQIVRRLDNGELLDNLISWGDLNDKSIDENDDKKMEKAIHKMTVQASFEEGVQKQRELEMLGGDFKVREEGGEFVQEQRNIENYYRYRLGRFAESKIRLDTLGSKLENLEKQKQLAPEILHEMGFGQDILIKTIQSIQTKIEQIVGEIKKEEEKPEAYLYIHGKRLKQMKDCLDNNGQIIETPYVKSKMESIIRSLDNNRPVFIHGELGSGKTELAKHIARKMMLKNWEKENPKPEDQEDISRWEIERNRVIHTDPLLISGHRGLDPEVMTGARTIERAENLSPEEQVQKIEAEWQKFTSKTKSANAETKKIFVNAWEEIFKSPVEVKMALGPFIQAMEQGKPIIIDELNAIPHTVLIMINDMITLKKGSTIILPIPGSEPITIKEGFAVIATGNYNPEDGLMYVGRQALDAAFLSRFDLYGYDYLPNNRALEPEGLTTGESRRWRQENELMGILSTRIMDRNLSITAPENTFRQLEKLSFVARNIQDVFSGKNVGIEWDAKSTSGNSISPREVLKENVLSIRHLIPIIEDWKKEGYLNPLDFYLFSKYVARSGARPEEKKYLYRTLQTMGDFFKESDGWPNGQENNAILELDESNIRKRLGEIKQPTIVTYGPIVVVEKLFGLRPKRKLTDTVLKSIFESQNSIEQQDVKADNIEVARMKDDVIEIFARLNI